MFAVLAAAAVAADSPPADVLSQVLGYGVLGIVVVLLLTRMLVPGWVVSRQDSAHQAELDARDAAHRREISAKDQTIAAHEREIAALRAGVDASNAFVRDEVVPALTRTAEISREYVAALNRRAGTS